MINGNLAITICLALYVIFITFRGYKVFILKRTRYSIEKSIYIFALFIYFSGLLYVTLFPIPIDSQLISDRIAEGFQEKNNFLPFKTIIDTFNGSSTSVMLTQIGGNLILLFPLGIFLPLIFDKFRIDMKKVLIIGIFVSCLIEISQQLISFFIGFTYKSFDFDDLILNSIGACLGYLTYKYIYPRRHLFFE